MQLDKYDITKDTALYKAVSTFTALFVCSFMMGQTANTVSSKTTVEPKAEVKAIIQEFNAPQPDNFGDTEQYETAKEQWVQQNGPKYQKIIDAGIPQNTNRKEDEVEGK